MEGGAAREDLGGERFAQTDILSDCPVGRARPARGRRAGAVLASRFPEYYNLKIEGKRERGKRIQTPTSGCQAGGQDETFGYNVSQHS